MKHRRICILLAPLLGIFLHFFPDRVTAAPNVGGNYNQLITSVDPYRQLAANAYSANSLQNAFVAGYRQKEVQEDATSGYKAVIYESIASPLEVVVAFAGTQFDLDFVDKIHIASFAYETIQNWSADDIVALLKIYGGMRFNHKSGYIDSAVFQRMRALIKTIPPSSLSTLLKQVDSDLEADIHLAINGTIPEQFKLAKSYAKNVISAYPRGTTVRFAGHSLGGALAQYVAALNRRDCITFNAPGLNLALFTDIDEANRTTSATGPYYLNLFSICGNDPFQTDMVSHPPKALEAALEDISNTTNDLSLKSTVLFGSPIPVRVVSRYDPFCHGISHFLPGNINTTHPAMSYLNVAFTGRSTKFNDVPARKRIESYIADGVRMGLFNGKSSTVFGYADPLTRLEAAFLLRSLATSANAARGTASSAFLPNPAVGSPPFTDLAGLNFDSISAISLLVANNITTTQNTEFRPNDAITMGEFASWLTAAFGLGSYVDLNPVGGLYSMTNPLAWKPAVGSNNGLRSNLENLQRISVYRRDEFDPSLEPTVESILPWGSDLGFSGTLDAQAPMQRRVMAVMVPNLFRFLVQNRF